jgi:hypothetical protein
VPDRLQRIFRLGCIALAALLVLRLGLAIRRATLLHNVAIPALPRLVVTETNKAAATDGSTNHSTVVKTNQLAAAQGGTNAPAATNAVAAAKPPTNNVVKGPGAPRPPRGMHGGQPKSDLPKPVNDQVDKIVKSGLLAPYMPPMPPALLGIADDEAFIRAGNGQTGAIKEGAELGNLKLLRIGINRVLIEEDGETKELTVFGGAGGASLMPAPDSAPPATNVPPVPATSATNRQTATLNPQKKGREKL